MAINATPPWRIGDVTVTRIVEMQVAGGTGFILPDARREAVRPIAWLAPHFMDADGRLIMSIHALVVDTGERRILVDTCIGNDKERSIPGWHMLRGRFLEDLAAAGYPRQSIDAVLCTHLHVDHVGWNTMRVGGAWMPTFANARYLMARKEWEHWRENTADQQFGDAIGDSVRPVFDAGLVDLVETDHVVTDQVWLEPTPGHTPGHVSVRISSRGVDAVITGDCIHHPCQMARPDWAATSDHDPDLARRTRRDFLTRAAGTRVLVIGTHFPTPTAGHVVGDGDAFRFEV
jgi:glyoxylase-like metal-dependent hydrolase (beta-lactamase superfamily II)